MEEADIKQIKSKAMPARLSARRKTKQKGRAVGARGGN